MGVLADLVAAVRAGGVEVVDLAAPFADTVPFALDEISRYDARGPAWYWNNIRTGEHTGTHFDAPVHWVTAKDGEDIAQIAPQKLLAPAAVLDLADQAASNPDFLLEIEHVRTWEKEHGPLPEGGWLLYRTGWDVRSADAEAFLNAGATPGISAECAKWLAEEAPVIGIGGETVGTDAGAAHRFD